MEEIKQTLLNKGLLDVNIELEELENYPVYVKIWFNFYWTDNPEKTIKGWQEFVGSNMEQVLQDIDYFLEKHRTGKWIIVLKKNGGI